MNERKIIIESAGQGTRLVLPKRDLGSAAKLGWVGVVFGGVVVLFMISWMWMPVSSGIEMIRNGNMFGVLFLLFGAIGLVGMFMAFRIISAGRAIVNNGTFGEITIADSKVVYREKLGWFSFKKITTFEQIESIRLSSPFDLAESSGRSAQTVSLGAGWLPDDLGTIFLTRKKSNVLAPLYPAELLVEAAVLIQRELAAAGKPDVQVVDGMDVSSSVDSVEAHSLVSGQKIVNADDEPLDLPAESKIEVTEQDDTSVFRVPSSGLWKGSHGLFFFSVLWNGFMVVFTSAMFLNDGENGEGIWVAVAVISLFWAVGLGMMVYAIYLGKQTAMIGVREGSLFIERKTIFGTNWTEFEPGQVASVEVGASGMAVNDVPVMQLHVYPRGKDKIGMFTQLADDELAWLAQNLRRQLGLKAGDKNWLLNNFDLNKELVAPAKSQVVVDQSEGETTIEVPALGLMTAKFSLLMSLLLTFVSFPLAIVLMIQFGFGPFAIIFPVVTTATGIGMLVYLLIYRTRRFVVRVTDRKLRIERRGYWSDHDFEVDRKNVRDVLVGDSGVRTNNRREMVLEIKCHKQSGFKMMHGRVEMEIGYVAALILQRLSLEEVSADSISD